MLSSFIIFSKWAKKFQVRTMESEVYGEKKFYKNDVS